MGSLTPSHSFFGRRGSGAESDGTVDGARKSNASWVSNISGMATGPNVTLLIHINLPDSLPTQK